MNSPTLRLVVGITIVVLAMAAAIMVNRRSQSDDGTLRYGIGYLLLGSSSLVMAGFAIGMGLTDDDIWIDTIELVSVLGLIVIFGAAAIYLLGEYFLVRGTYDMTGISLHTPWKGTKHGRWSDLVSVRHNTNLSLHELNFRDGTQIRLSQFVAGHSGVVEIASQQEL
ncbi:MAG: hypothetical protein AAGH76_08975 [Pseudomonadota bacterium]